MRTLVSFLIFFVMCGSTARSQGLAKGNTILSFGASLPTADFADTQLRSIRSGWAGIGLGIGLSSYYPMKKKGLSLMWGLDLIINPYSKDAKDIIDRDLSNTAENKYPLYFHLPLRGGFDYRFSPQKDLEIFANAGLTADIQKRTNIITSWSNYPDDKVTSFNIATGFGSYIGAGMKVKNKMTYGIDYYMLGKHRMKAKWEEGSESGNYLTEKFAITMVKMYVAFPFGK